MLPRNKVWQLTLFLGLSAIQAIAQDIDFQQDSCSAFLDSGFVDSMSASDAWSCCVHGHKACDLPNHKALEFPRFFCGTENEYPKPVLSSQDDWVIESTIWYRGSQIIKQISPDRSTVYAEVVDFRCSGLEICVSCTDQNVCVANVDGAQFEEFPIAHLDMMLEFYRSGFPQRYWAEEISE